VLTAWSHVDVLFLLVECEAWDWATVGLCRALTSFQNCSVLVFCVEYIPFPVHDSLGESSSQGSDPQGWK
jgi:hypothetical protein